MATNGPQPEQDFSNVPEQQGLQRHLKNRHLQLMAIGGAIGTGLFMGSGRTISLAGPSVIFTYALVGFFLFFMMRAMGEMLLSNLKYKSFADFIYDYLGPMAGFFVGWTYWFCWVATAVSDTVAMTGYIQYWWADVPLWLPAAGFIVLLISLNSLSVRWFGESEFWFALIKIIAIVGLIAAGGWLMVTHFQGPDHSVAQLSNLWEHGGWFPKGFTGFMAAFQLAVFAFVGMELVGTTSAEAENPAKNLPRAINAIPVRIMVFYILALLAIMVVTPWTHVNPDKSPFVNMFTLLGIPIAASLINFVVLTSAASSANSGVYSTGRMLYGLSKTRLAPAWFGKLTRHNVPWNGVLYTCLYLVVGVALLYQGKGIMDVFELVTTVSSLCFIFVWSMIMLAYLKYRKVHPQLHSRSLYKMPGGQTMSLAVLAFFVFIIYALTQKPDTLKALYFMPLWFLVLFAAYPFYKKSAQAHQ